MTYKSSPGSGNLLLLGAIGLIATSGSMLSDLYLPGLPGMADYFLATPTQVQLTITAALAGVAVGQLVMGPLSDRFGRRGVLLAGYGIAVVAALLTALAPTLLLVIAARFILGFGVGTGLALGRAIVNDVVSGPRAVQWLGTIAVFTGLGGLLAPLIGGWLSTGIGWRAPLWALLFYLVLALIAITALVPETHTVDRRRLPAGVRSSLAIFTPSFIFYTLCLAFAFGAYFACISASPFIYQEFIGWTPLESGYMFAGQALLMTVASFATSRLAMRVSTKVLLGTGVGLILSAGLLSILISVTGLPVLLYPPLVLLVSIGIGITLPTSMALALAHGRPAAGLASAALGCVQFIIASSIAPLVSLGSAPLATFSVVLTSAAVISLVTFVLATNSDRRVLHSSK